MRISEEQRGMTRPEKDRYGGIAQLGEHLLCKQGVCGSIPHISTRAKSHEARQLTRGLNDSKTEMGL